MTRVAITGLGLMTGIGAGTDETWSALLAGRSGVARIGAFDPSGLASQLGVEIPGFDATRYVANRRALRNMTRNDQLAIAGASLAVQDAKFEARVADDPDGDEVALFLGGNKEISHLDKVVDAALAFRGEDGKVTLSRVGSVGRERFYPLFYVEGLQAAALFYISKAFGLRGENTYFAGTSEAGATAIGRAFRTIRRGDARAAIAGGWDDATSWWHAGKMDAMGGLSRANELGARACRPYDTGRDGAVLGEGAAFVVLEDADGAAARSVEPYAEILGFGAGFDADGLLAPAIDGRGLRHAIQRALDDAGIGPDEVDFVATHGSGTKLGDASEAAALRSVFGARAAEVAASSVKPATGHIVAGAGALNVAVAALAVRHGAVPPTLNLTDVDPECAGVGWVRDEARQLPVRTALATARGMHGQNVVVALRAAQAGD